MKLSFSAVVALMFALVAPSWADNPPDSPPSEDTGRTFAGLHFAVALSVTHDLDDNRVEDATIEYEFENGELIPKVRVTKTNNTRARLMLETHYFFLSEKSHVALTRYQAGDKKGPSPALHGWGPFVALQPGSDEIVEALGAGLMWGWRRSAESSRSFNLALGIVTDNNVKVLGNGFIEDHVAPRDESGNPVPIRFKQTDQVGLLLLSSFTF